MEHRCSANLSLSWLSLCIARYLYCTGYTPEQKMHLFLSFNLPSEVTDFPPFSYTLTIVKSLLYKRCPFRAESPSIGHLIGSTSGFKPFPPAFASILTLLGFLFKSRGLGKHHQGVAFSSFRFKDDLNFVYTVLQIIKNVRE